MELKNKPKVVYSLIVLVIVIWVSIFIRIFTFESSQPNNIIPQKQVALKSKVKADKKHFLLLLNYPDPFVGNSNSQDITVNNSTTNEYSSKNQFAEVAEFSSNSKKNETPIEVIPEIHYVGMLGNSSKDKKVAILTIAHKKCILSEGDTCQRFQIVSILRDSIVVLFAKKKLIFHKKR